MRRLGSLLVFAVVAALAAAACSDNRVAPPRIEDAPRRTRSIPHPTNPVYPLPPFKLTSDAIGPYKLGQTLAAVVYASPAGSSGIEVLDIPGVVRLSVHRVEDNQMIVGADPVLTTFVSVLAPDVALTEGGIEVGSTRAALVESLGPPVVRPGHVADPRLVSVASLPGASFIVVRDVVVAALISAPSTRPDAGANMSQVAAPTCGLERPAASASASGSANGRGSASGSGSPTIVGPTYDALAAALGGRPERIDCLSANDAVAAVGDELVVVATGEKPRRLGAMRVPGLVYAGAVYGAKETRDEIVAVTLARSDDELVYEILALRWEGGRLVKTFDEVAYRVPEQGAGMLGAKLADLDLVLDVEARADVLVATGVLLGRTAATTRLAVPLTPISVARKKRPAVDTGSGGVSDASVQPLGDAAPLDAPSP
jgi:hypothetical protein